MISSHSSVSPAYPPLASKTAPTFSASAVDECRKRKGCAPARASGGAIMLPIILAVVSVLAAVPASAKGRMPAVARQDSKVKVDPAAEHAATLAELDAWLRRLQGQFRLSVPGSLGLEGIADCAGIGDGPGVHCIFRVGPASRKERWSASVRLFGLDMGAPGISYLQLNSNGTVEGGVAKLQGDTITFRVDCPVAQSYGRGAATMTACRRELRIRAPADGKLVRIRSSFYVRWSRPPRGNFAPDADVPGIVEWLLERKSAGGQGQ